MEATEEQFDLMEMIEMSKTISQEADHLPVDKLITYLQHYVQLLKTLGKLVEIGKSYYFNLLNIIGFSDINAKSRILSQNQHKFEQKGEDVKTIQQLVDLEVNMGLGKVNGTNNSYQGIPKKSEFIHILEAQELLKESLDF